MQKVPRRLKPIFQTLYNRFIARRLVEWRHQYEFWYINVCSRQRDHLVYGDLGTSRSCTVFGLQFSTESPLYQQWHSAVNVSAFVPLVFEGMPTEYQNGVAVLGDDVEANDARLGAVCKDSTSIGILVLCRTPKAI